jgi:putative membrane protein
MESPQTFFKLLLGTIIYRPYVYAFFVCFAFFAIRHLRVRGTIAWTVMAWIVAFLSEYSSTRNGFPFGIYRYFDETRTRELWISNVPFWDSLSFVFLSYFSWILAGAILRQKGSLSSTLKDTLMRPSTTILSGILMMLLDIVIDPLTLLGDRWFLGRIYDYPTGGTYFGVTIANFAGWFFVGMVIPLIYQQMTRWKPLAPATWRIFSPLELWASYGVYSGVFLFNLGITAWLSEWTLLAASSCIAGWTLLSCLFFLVPKLRKSSIV